MIQESRSTPPRSRAMAGSAVATIVWSMIARNIGSMIEGKSERKDADPAGEDCCWTGLSKIPTTHDAVRRVSRNTGSPALSNSKYEQPDNLGSYPRQRVLFCVRRHKSAACGTVDHRIQEFSRGAAWFPSPARQGYCIWL